MYENESVFRLPSDTSLLFFGFTILLYLFVIRMYGTYPKAFNS